jgi:hypothetical protein
LFLLGGAGLVVFALGILLSMTWLIGGGIGLCALGVLSARANKRKQVRGVKDAQAMIARALIEAED